MRKKFFSVLLISTICTIILYGCKIGDDQNSYPSGSVKYDLLLNSGSVFVYAFQDPGTGVWYLGTSEGVTPRLNDDGSLYAE